MNYKFIDITGQKFGKIKVIKISEEKPYGKQKFWYCICDSGYRG